MKRVGWLVDRVPVLGGAELTQAEFRAAAPSGVEIVDCPVGAVEPGLDRYVIHNCVSYTLEDLELTAGAPAVKYWHDVGPHVSAAVRAWLDLNAVPVCCSPLQAAAMGLTDDALLIPPAIDLEAFTAAAAATEVRAGAVSIGNWGNPGKSPGRVAEWATQNQTGVQFFGGGVCAPPGAREVPPEAMPALLASFEMFVYLPTALEPFGRVVAEAWAAGCSIVTNGQVGARHWIEKNPAALDTAAEDFWKAVLS